MEITIMKVVFGLWLCVLVGAITVSGSYGVHAETPPGGDGTIDQVPSQPNIVLILTDDQDIQLGGVEPIPKTRRLIGGYGATASNWMVHTPVCELLTSRYFHNIKVSNLKDKSCMHVNADPSGPFSDWLFSPHLKSAGYTNGLFGKYLNNFVPLSAPPGIDEWLANDGGNYINPTFNYNGVSKQFGPSEYAGYSTSVIGNVSINWIDSIVTNSSKPFFAYIAPKAPHIQDGSGFPKTIPAPWYENAFPNVKAPRTPNYNLSCPDHHWMIAQQQPMTQQQMNESDSLFQTRWQSLLSVDDLVEALVGKLEALGVLNNTYIIYTSDHGFRFGQFRMPQGKWNVYENDIRIPMMIRGPGITPNSTFDLLGSNVDIMASVLGLAGIDTPSSMDGRSIIPYLISAHQSEGNTQPLPASTRQHIQRSHQAQMGNATSWRQDLLIEYYSVGDVVRYEHLEDTANNTFRAIRSISEQGNYLLAEFTDLNTNYNFQKPGYFYELFDLDKDPFQLTNIYNTTSPTIIATLMSKLKQLYTCQGHTCN